MLKKKFGVHSKLAYAAYFSRIYIHIHFLILKSIIKSLQVETQE